MPAAFGRISEQLDLIVTKKLHRNLYRNGLIKELIV
jgi:hypothetical protein